ncbi:sulfotransferase family protein [Streptomyces sp. B6B3]|uniref:sulfotransferase family protein n=1 Tax=Streptomyces sp. B6B3 TaxID=3153570 RepID=UPI00325CCEC0
MRVIGAAFGRTGTSSVRLALETLELGPTHGMKALFDDPAHARRWLRLADRADGAHADWDGLLGAYRSTVAWPATFYWRELIAAYPTARVLLVTRDPEAWYASMARTLYRTRPRDDGRAVADQLIERVVWQGTFGGRFDDREHAIAVYRAHQAEVRATVPADRLVEFEVGQGWGPLCAGLGVPVPATAFPRVNTTDEYLHRAQRAGALPADHRGDP